MRGYALAMVSISLLACTSPGEGAKAERGYQRSDPVIAALAEFHEDRGQYPDSLTELVPDYLRADALETPSAPQENYPLEYRRLDHSYELSFRYAGPGMNRCTYSPLSDWQCRGWF